MTTESRQYRIECDGCHLQASPFTDKWVDATRAAQSRGWLIILGSDMHFCPDCQSRAITHAIATALQ